MGPPLAVLLNLMPSFVVTLKKFLVHLARPSMGELAEFMSAVAAFQDEPAPAAAPPARSRPAAATARSRQPSTCSGLRCPEQ